MTASSHDSFAELAAAYALGALDPSERQRFEAHLTSCVTCQREVTEMRRVTAGLGMAVDPVTPPESLKARTIAKATAQPPSRAMVPAPPATTRTAPKAGMSFEWLLAAASVAIAVGVGLYAWSLRSQLGEMRQTMAELSDRANELRNSRDDARREAARLSHVVEIVQAPATIQVNLTGTKDSPNALGRAYFNATRGMVVSTERMPALRPGRAYQLWVIVGSEKPKSAGVFTVTSDGVASFTATLPANLAVPAGTAMVVAVTEEPAGGSDGPTLPVLLAGEMKGR